MKQTAVDILYKFLYEMESFEGFDPYSFNQKDVFKKAKEMEKEQMKDAFVECWKSNVPDGIECKLDAEQYYNETFKSE
jgi:hypothetical protein